MASLALPTAAVAGDPLVAPKVVFQVSDGDLAKWNLALNNARNVQKDRKGAIIEIVAITPKTVIIRSNHRHPLLATDVINPAVLPSFPGNNSSFSSSLFTISPLMTC